MWEQLDRLAAMPPFLTVLDDPVAVQNALAGAIPGLQRAKLSDLRLTPSGWTGRCALVLDGAEAVTVAARVVPPGHAEPQPAGSVAGRPGSDGWRCWLPELWLELESRGEDDVALPALVLLTDPERARALLESAIRTGAPRYRDLRILAATPKVMRYSPGSRCTVVYLLRLPRESLAGGWPDVVVAKTYHRSDKGRRAWDGMQALWQSPLGSSSNVTIAEPLAWLPELNVLVQGPIRQEQTLKELLLHTLSHGSDGQEDLRGYLTKTAIGLVELHHCGVMTVEPATWDEELADVTSVLTRLTSVVPELEGAADGFFADLRRLADRAPADPELPAHRSFRPAQVLVHQGRIGFIDFDGFCRAEPALDVALFRATVRDLAMSVLPAETPLEDRLRTTDDLCEHFLARYEALAPVSRERVALWEALDLTTNVVHSWTKVKPARLAHAMTLLRHHAAHALAAKR